MQRMSFAACGCKRLSLRSASLMSVSGCGWSGNDRFVLDHWRSRNESFRKARLTNIYDTQPVSISNKMVVRRNRIQSSLVRQSVETPQRKCLRSHCAAPFCIPCHSTFLFGGCAVNRSCPDDWRYTNMPPSAATDEFKTYHAVF